MWREEPLQVCNALQLEATREGRVTPRLVLLRVGAERFALPLEGVWHILPTQRIFPLALIRPGFRGVFLYQGEVVPLLDLPALVGRGRR